MSNQVNIATAVELHAEIARLHGEIDRLRLTDAERLAIQWVVDASRLLHRVVLSRKTRMFAIRELRTPPIMTPCQRRQPLLILTHRVGQWIAKASALIKPSR